MCCENVSNLLPLDQLDSLHWHIGPQFILTFVFNLILIYV